MFLKLTNMKKTLIAIAALALGFMVSCSTEKTAELKCSTTLNGEEDSTFTFPEKDGYIYIFNGKDLAGWRGYGLDHVTERWVVEDSCLKFDTNVEGKGGDIIFAHKFKNFEMQLEWKISEGGNSGIFYLAQEVRNEEGNLEPIFISAPECQVLDNENHPDAKMGKDGNRKSSSLYDMIPATPQNAKPFGEWNAIKITVKDGVVTHYQNGEQVVQYKLWTPEWTAMLQDSKFSEEAWPAAFKLLNNCGGENHEGFIGFQDHGNDVWFRNIRVKEL